MLVISELMEPHPGMSICFARALCHTRRTAFQKLLRIVLLTNILNEEAVAKKLHRDLLERQDVLQILEEESIAKLVRELGQQGIEKLRDKLRSKEPLLRLITIQTASKRRLPLIPELIECLDDPVPAVRQTARQTLVRLSRGTDFGPSPKAGKAVRRRSMEKWRHWLAIQKAVPLIVPRTSMSTLAMDRADPLAEAEDAEVARLREELVTATGAKQAAVLRRLTTATGELPTIALAQAVPYLSEPLQGKARIALVERLGRGKAKELRECLADEDAELRRAAACACGRTKDRGHVPKLIPLLLDPEAAVSGAALEALRGLTGQDFGPRAGVSAADRACAAAVWKEWWARQRESSQGTTGGG